MTLQGLITAYNSVAPVSTAEGVSRAIEWFYIVEVYTLENPEEVPNGNSVIFACEEYARNTQVKSTDYDTINNNLYHVRCMIDAIIQQTAT